ncbi:AmmeMemoRadiSam system protein B [Pseudothauera rhizosphaerae]|uniref:MEMO1 family protein E6O51_05405 n=1 Tax=Pseudothauera rhizosphaerae TaxID=2565932 RepID=A0A4S4AU81_9RHOO|nr:AmmeMemoRadiSam system protein B [Pseudothauera rhizosphaerae]THF63491.1 AmmeMemoRadiSam system protein B [Pseudothauera rhizosphaerae]
MAIASVRPPAVAGQFYPGDPLVLSAQLSELLTTAVPLENVPPPKAVIVPHAGYIYSGPIAATAYAVLAPLRDVVRKVVMLGPTHRVAVDGFSLPATQAFATPLGEVPLARADWLALQARADVSVDDRPHAFEHCLEVQLPFLQTVLGRFELVPVLVGRANAEAVADLIESVWGGPETLILISSDLSHYLSYEQARHCDRATIEQVIRLQVGLNHEQACGATPINGLLRVAQRHGLEPHLLDLRNSGDTAGDRGRVVGYASVAFCESPAHAAAPRH